MYQMSRRTAAVIALVVALTGCARLVIHEADSPGTKTGKVLGRIGFGVVTLGISEAAMPSVKAVLKRKAMLEDFRVELSRMVGALSFDDALRIWGPPRNTHEGNEIIIGQWYNRELVRAWPPSVDHELARFPLVSGYELQLMFDKRTHLLQSGRYREGSDVYVTTIVGRGQSAP